MLDVIILAAGKGSRMLSDTPKVMHCLSGRPLIYHVISTARKLLESRQGVITVVSGHGSDQVDPFVTDLGCRVVRQNDQLGTGHALDCALQNLDPNGTTLVLCGDVPLIRHECLTSLLAQGEFQLAVLTAIAENPNGYGRIVRDDMMELCAIVEHNDASEEQKVIREINSGIYAAPTRLLKDLLHGLQSSNSQGEYYLTDCVELCVRSGRAVVTVEGPIEEILGINDQRQLSQVNSLHQDMLRHQLLSKGVNMLDPRSVFINGTVLVGCDVIIEPNVMLNGHVEIGDRVTIGFGSHLNDSTIGSDTILKPYTVMESTSVGHASRLGPFSRLRSGTVLADETHIGNFCETKNTHLGVGAKVNHLAYVGDSVIGANTNIGAGTITCNYDGADKHITTIGQDVFIGSNTSLVAPVHVSDGATVGAGSVVTKDVGIGQLALSRADQINISGYQRPEKSKG